MMVDGDRDRQVVGDGMIPGLGLGIDHAMGAVLVEPDGRDRVHPDAQQLDHRPIGRAPDGAAERDDRIDLEASREEVLERVGAGDRVGVGLIVRVDRHGPLLVHGRQHPLEQALRLALGLRRRGVAVAAFAGAALGHSPQAPDKTRRAISRKRSAMGESGREWTIGSPASPEGATSSCSGIVPRNGTPYRSAVDRPPPCEKIWCSEPQSGHTNVPMFSTIPITRAPTLSNMRRPFRASMSAMSCGVVTMIAPSRGTAWVRVRCASPVPGGMSTTSQSVGPQSTSRRNWVTAEWTIGPRHTIGVSSSTRNPSDMTRMPYLSTGWIRFPTTAGFTPLSPIIV